MQARAAATVDTLFEAAARILESGDAARLTNNRIAERAGFSIGTLYGYFPNKRGLLRAMALREARRQQVHVLAALDEAGRMPAPRIWCASWCGPRFGPSVGATGCGQP